VWQGLYLNADVAIKILNIGEKLGAKRTQIDVAECERHGGACFLLKTTSRPPFCSAQKHLAI
jgi:hypothetical protein